MQQEPAEHTWSVIGLAGQGRLTVPESGAKPGMQDLQVRAPFRRAGQAWQSAKPRLPHVTHCTGEASVLC